MKPARFYAKLTLLSFIFFIQNLQSQVTPTNELARYWLSQKDQDENYLFAICADPHNKEDIYELSRLSTFLSEMEAYDPAFVICCGDLTNYGTAGELDLFNDTVNAWMNTTHIPVFCVPGNHDLYTGTTSLYEQYIGITDDYFDFSTDRFILINSMQKGTPYGYYEITSSQLQTAEGWMQGASGNIFSFMHAQFIGKAWCCCGLDINEDCCVGGDGCQGCGANEISDGPEPGYTEYHNLLKQYNAIGQFNGHTHGYNFTNYENVNYLTVGNMDWSLCQVDHCNNITVTTFLYQGPDNNLLLYDMRNEVLVNSNTISDCIKCTEVSTKIITQAVNPFEQESYHVSNYILANNSIHNGGHAKYLAANYVKLSSGFKAFQGSYFKASAEECNIIQIPASAFKNSSESIAYSNIDQEAYLRLYPNPTNGFLYIEAPDEFDKAIIEIFDVLGGKVVSGTISGKTNTINLSGNQRGTYFLKIYSDNKVYTHILILN